jgi:predicted nucleic acid-binding protein
MKIALDTNVLVYAEGHGDAARCQRARAILAALDPAQVLLPVQVLGELHRVLIGKARRPAQEVRAAILSWADTYACLATDLSIMIAAQDLVADHQFSIWDAVVLASAASAGCRVLLTEDLWAGFTWGGVTVVNPFAEPPVPMLLQFMSP